MTNPDEKKIVAIAMSGVRRAQAYASWDGKQLFIGKIIEAGGDPGIWLPEMIADINTKIQEGWVVLVEDRTHSFPANSISYNFDSIGPDGRTNFQSCLDWYFDLQGRGGIAIKSQYKHYTIRQGDVDSMINLDNDDKGRLVYKIDWQKITPAHRAILMCVAGALQEEPLSERWINAYLDTKPGLKKENNRLHIFRTMCRLDESRMKEFDAAVEATEAKKHARH